MRPVSVCLLPEPSTLYIIYLYLWYIAAIFIGLPHRCWFLKSNLAKYRFSFKNSEFPLPVFLLCSLLIPQDTEMSNCGQACEELIFSQCLGTSHQTVLHSLFGGVQTYSPSGVCPHTHTHTLCKAQMTHEICAINESESSGLD